MQKFLKSIQQAKNNKNELFYNTSGSKEAYQLGIKHLGASEYLGFTLRLPNGDLRVQKPFLLVDFQAKTLNEFFKGDSITPIKLI